MIPQTCDNASDPVLWHSSGQHGCLNLLGIGPLEVDCHLISGQENECTMASTYQLHPTIINYRYHAPPITHRYPSQQISAVGSFLSPCWGLMPYKRATYQGPPGIPWPLPATTRPIVTSSAEGGETFLPCSATDTLDSGSFRRSKWLR